MKHRPARRRLLQIISSLCATLSCRPVAALALLEKDNTPALLARLSNIYDDIASAAALGKTYLELYPEEATARQLAALICPDAQQRNRFLRADITGLRRLLGNRVRMDFASGNTVRLSGWVLSRTEARLYGLAAINPSLPGARS